MFVEQMSEESHTQPGDRVAHARLNIPQSLLVRADEIIE
jgi:uncharacterized glyoxalase superfamily protein PhnB